MVSAGEVIFMGEKSLMRRHAARFIAELGKVEQEKQAAASTEEIAVLDSLDSAAASAATASAIGVQTLRQRPT